MVNDHVTRFPVRSAEVAANIPFHWYSLYIWSHPFPGKRGETSRKEMKRLLVDIRFDRIPGQIEAAFDDFFAAFVFAVFMLDADNIIVTGGGQRTDES